MKKRFVLSFKCLPAQPPWLTTLLGFMVNDLYVTSPIVSALIGAFVVVLWLAYLGALMTQQQVDLFEDYEKRMNKMNGEQKS